MPFLFLEHTADVQVECVAPTFQELLQTATQALYAVALKQVRETKQEKRVVSTEGLCHEEVLVRWLQELLFLLDTERFVLTEARFHVAAEDRVEAEVRGYFCGADERADEIKAVTYHDLKIEETTEGLRARIIFDL